ncbi:MAG: transposase [Burkholderiales bacterium]|nr:transposase [Burkholderiales bacterium]
MARLPRLTLPGLPHLVIQRGNNRQSIFEKTADYQTLLDLLAENASKYRVAVHAYVLMQNHFHLLVTPQTGEGLPLLMQSVGRRYVRYFNDTHHRTGTLWEGRYRSTVIEAETYLLACMVYFDLNPVRSGLASQAGDYPWSSYSHYSGQHVDKLISAHPLVWALGNTPFAREAAYTQMVRAGISAVQQKTLTDATLSGWALGSQIFVEELQKNTPRRLTKSRAGRPTTQVKD